MKITNPLYILHCLLMTHRLILNLNGLHENINAIVPGKLWEKLLRVLALSEKDNADYIS